MNLERLAALLRVLGNLALWAAVLAVFYQPLSLALTPWIGTAVEEIETGTWLGSGPSRGFMLQVASIPAGAEVWVDGTLRTQTPAIANVTCRNGAAVTILLRHPEHSDFERTLECREGGSLRMQIRLDPP